MGLIVFLSQLLKELVVKLYVFFMCGTYGCPTCKVICAIVLLLRALQGGWREIKPIDRLRTQIRQMILGGGLVEERERV